MRRLAHAILAVVVAFVLVVAATLYARSRTREVEPIGPTPVKADLHVKEVRVEEEAGKVRWRLQAEQALMYGQAGAGRTELRHVRVEVSEPDRTWTISGERGEYLQKERKIELRGNVVVTSSDGLRLETDVLRWDGEGRRLWTDAPVTLSAPGGVVRGNTLEVAMASDATTIGGRVRARFEPSGHGGRAAQDPQAPSGHGGRAAQDPQTPSGHGGRAAQNPPTPSRR